MRGKFITMEGCEGVGKSTQVSLLIDYLTKLGKKVYFTREPGGTVISEQIRKVILDPENTEMDAVTELLLYIASRRQLTKETIEKKLEEGFYVICDRFTDSTLAYQGYARGLDKELIKKLNEIAVGEVTIDATVFLDLDPANSFIRKGGADMQDRLERENIEFHKKVYEGYRHIAAENPDRVICVDASAGKEEIAAMIIEALEKKGII